jgi:hypothetical protein
MLDAPPPLDFDVLRAAAEPKRPKFQPIGLLVWLALIALVAAVAAVFGLTLGPSIP